MYILSVFGIKQHLNSENLERREGNFYSIDRDAKDQQVEILVTMILLNATEAEIDEYFEDDEQKRA